MIFKDSLRCSLCSCLFVLCSSLFSKPPFRSAQPACFLCCWKAELSLWSRIITLISSIISLWASSSAGPLLPLSNPFTYVSHQLPISFPMVAVTVFLQLLLPAPSSTSPAPFFAEGFTSYFLEKTDVLRPVSSQFPLPPPNSVFYGLLCFSTRSSWRRLATHLCSQFHPLPLGPMRFSLSCITCFLSSSTFFSPAYRRPPTEFSWKKKSYLECSCSSNYLSWVSLIIKILNMVVWI